MGTRTEDLTPSAKPIADRLAKRVGHLKVALSAGIIALNHLDADDKEAMIGLANDAAEEVVDLYAERRALIELKTFVIERMLLIGDFIHPTAKPICDKVLELANRGIAHHVMLKAEIALTWTDEEKREALESILLHAGPELKRAIPRMVQEAGLPQAGQDTAESAERKTRKGKPKPPAV